MRRDFPGTLTFTFVAVILALAGCESEGGTATPATDGGSSLQGRVSGVVTFGIEEGVVFETGEKPANSGTRNTDVIAYEYTMSAGRVSMKLEAGTMKGAMRVIKNPHGTALQSFDSLDDVPFERPSSSEHDILVNPARGDAFVILGNVTTGHARFLVLRGPGDAGSDAAGNTVELWYEAVVEPNCSPHDYTECSGGAVYWVDSCGYREELHERCGSSDECVGGACAGGSVCRVTCDGAEFSYSCGSGSSTSNISYCSNGNVSSTVVRYDNGHTVTCLMNCSGAGGTCWDDTGSSCQLH